MPETPSRASHLGPFTVGDWLVDPRSCVVSRGETTERLRPQLVDLLVCLAKRPGHLVLKDEILSDVWLGQCIAESGLSRCIAELRQILQDDAQQPRFIETIPKRGYRLIATVAGLEEPPSAPNAPGGGAPDATEREAGDPGRQPTAGLRLTGRRTRVWAGAGLAVVLVGIAVAVLLTMSPPVAVLTERDTVLLADVSNATRDRVFDDALRLALAVELEQAPFLRILPQEAVRGALVRASRSPDERVIGPLALEVCRREGAAVLLAGSIASLGSRYVVGLEAIACSTGESLGRVMREAGSKERVLTALEQAASRIRQRLGESRDSLRQHDVPLARATTPSLEALKALSLGDFNRDHARLEEALALYRQATELDPQFALAWARLGVVAWNLTLREEALPALSRAYELRDRASQPERFYIEAHHYRFAGDPQRTIETYRAWQRMYPGSPVPPTNLASTFSTLMGQYDAALREAHEAVRLAPYSSLAHRALITAYRGSGRIAEAKKAAAGAASHGVDDQLLHRELLNLALVEGDQAAIERESRWAAGSPVFALRALRMRAASAMARGRLGEARHLWLDAVAKAGEIGPARRVAEVRIYQAEAEALLGDARAARAALDAALAAERREMALVNSAILFGVIGEFDRARALLAEIDRLPAPDPAALRGFLPVARALAEAGLGHQEAALGLLRPVTPFEKAQDLELVPVGVRGLVARAAGRSSDAAAACDDLVALRAISPASPWVPFARLARARALLESGDAAGSRTAYDAFLESWKDADPDAPLLRAARRERAALAAVR
jgi:eukaryotic-like serine/threonine-protein kinase